MFQNCFEMSKKNHLKVHHYKKRVEFKSSKKVQKLNLRRQYLSISCFFFVQLCYTICVAERSIFFHFDYVCACHKPKLNCSYYDLLHTISRFHSQSSEHQHRKLNADAICYPLCNTMHLIKS